MATITPQVGTITSREAEQVERANASGKTPVVFIHGLWLLPSSWDRWVEVFEQAGFAALTPRARATPRGKARARAWRGAPAAASPGGGAPSTSRSRSHRKRPSSCHDRVRNFAVDIAIGS